MVTDRILESLAANLALLEHLHIVGCPKVTHRGICHLLSANCNGLVGLGLENLAPTFVGYFLVITGFIDNLIKDISDFSRICTESGALRRLRYITLTINVHTAGHIPKWFEKVEGLLSSSPIEVFQIYSTFSCLDLGSMVAMDDFCSRIVCIHGRRLTQFSVHRMRMSVDAILDICLRCKALQQLFVVAHSKDLVRVCDYVTYKTNLENMTGCTC